MHFKMQYHCFRFSIPFVWSGVSIPIVFKLRKGCGQDIFLFMFFSFLVLFFVLWVWFVHLIVGLDNVWPTFF